MKNRQALARHFAKLGYRVGAEIGVCTGYYSNILCQTIPNLKLYDLDLENIKKYRVFLARFVNKQGLPLKRITQNYHLIALRSLFKFLVKRDIRTLAPEKIELPKAE
ncbi:MAG: hypothetical protein AABW93_02500, partial [Nanoarchaeota archaeon]